MESTTQNVKYPQNLVLKQEIQDSGKSVKHLARKIKCSTTVLSLIINGHYLGTRLKELLKEELKG